ncbi:MAG: hypothetical protein AAGA93_21585 [Actinomycetota bacterium]
MTPEIDGRPVRRLARQVEAIHTVAYYSPEIGRLTDDGYRGWWHAYFAYRAAPMGPVPASVVTATFYNFAPRMVERAVPGVWGILTPAEILARRNELVAEALGRIWADGRLDAELAEAAELSARAVAAIEIEARPLAAAHAELPWPDGSPALRLWHACTIWREYRGDGHNLALAAAGVDGLESHLLMAAHGHGNQATITGIRGWTDEEWAAAGERLTSRGILVADGTYTDAGRRFRSDVEGATDERSAGPLDRLEPDEVARLQDLLGVITADLLECGAVPGVWPPPNVRRS